MKSKLFFLVALFTLLGTQQSQAQEGMVGEVRMFAGNFAPRGWAFCEGQLLPISSNSALFSILGTTYGGDGRTTFALPDLRGRAAIGTGQGPGLNNYPHGQKGGSETTSLKFQSQPLPATRTESTSSVQTPYQTPINNMQPFLSIRYIICMQGIYPSRN